jgi:hypothetical protein
VVLENVQQVELGGGGLALGEDPPPAESSFHVPPHPSCSARAWWYVGEIGTD